MSEMSFDQMLDEYVKPIKSGSVVDGTVVSVKPDEIILNINAKSEGTITRNEYTNESNVDLTTVVNVGDKMEAVVIKVKTGAGGKLFGAIASKEIAAALADQTGLEVDKKKIVLDEPIKELGTHIVKAKLHRDVTAEVTVKVVEE